MRISTNSIYETGTSQLGTLQSQLARTQMQLSTQRRMITAADDPIASASALEVTQSQSMNTQFATNRQNAGGSLSQVELALQGTTVLLQDVQSIVVSAGNGALSDANRQAFATELEGRLNDLLGLANSADGAGGYLFSGYKSTTLPFTQTATGADYQGDQGQRMMQVASSRQMPISDSGSSVFENNLTGNGKFQTVAASQNTGSGIVSSGAVTNPSQFVASNYTISFAVGGTPATTTYTVTDSASPPSTSSPATYESGKQITFGGMAFDIKGDPANGDTFSIKPSVKQSVFTTVTELIATLRGPASGSAGQAALTNGLNKASENLDSALNNVLTVRATIGSRLKELDYLDSAGDDLGLQYSSTLSNLQELDTVKALSLFAQQKFTLEAAQQSFKAMSGLSLFNYIS